MFLLKIIEESFNNEKLKKIRIKRNLSLAEVAEKINISEATLYRYESGITKKIPMKTIKKIAEIYDIDYTYFYGLPSLPLTGSITGIIMSTMYGISLTSILNGTSIGGLIGILSYKIIKKYFEKIKSENPKDDLYEQLTEEEKDEYEAFKVMTYSFLKTKQVFSKDEMESDEAFLFSYYFAHKVKRESKIIDIDENKGEDINGR